MNYFIIILNYVALLAILPGLTMELMIKIYFLNIIHSYLYLLELLSVF